MEWGGFLAEGNERTEDLKQHQTTSSDQLAHQVPAQLPPPPSPEPLRAEARCGAGQVGEGLREHPTHAGSFKYCHIKVDDVAEEDLVAYFPRCFAFMEQAATGDDMACVSGGGVLVHCAAGVSRSATVCIGCAHSLTRPALSRVTANPHSRAHISRNGRCTRQCVGERLGLEGGSRHRVLSSTQHNRIHTGGRRRVASLQGLRLNPPGTP